MGIIFLICNFTLRLIKNIEKMILRKCVLFMLSVGQREKTISALSADIILIEISIIEICNESTSTYIEVIF